MTLLERISDYAEKYSVPKEQVFNENPNLIELLIPKHSPDWHNFRANGIGASEIGVVVGVNIYKTLPQLVEEKVGTMSSYRPSNEAMISGLLAEKTILRRWMYYDGTDLGYVEKLAEEIDIPDHELNVLEHKIVRYAEAVHSYIINVKYPYLFVSLDAKVFPNQQHLSGVVVPQSWPLESKTIRHWEAAKWDQGIPAMYRFQIQTQMLVTETDYAELATLEDGQRFKVYPFKKDPAMQEIIIQKGEETFMLIQDLKVMKEEMEYYMSKNDHTSANRVKAEYDSLLPLPSDEEVAKQYYSAKMLREKSEFGGTNEDLELVRNRMYYNGMIKLMEKEKQYYENLVMRRFTLEQAEYMKFGEQKVRYHKIAGRENYQLDFRSMKNVVDAKYLEMQFNKIIPKSK